MIRDEIWMQTRRDWLRSRSAAAFHRHRRTGHFYVQRAIITRNARKMNDALMALLMRPFADVIAQLAAEGGSKVHEK